MKDFCAAQITRRTRYRQQAALLAYAIAACCCFSLQRAYQIALFIFAVLGVATLLGAGKALNL